MYYYEVIPADRNYHGQESLTYSYENLLQNGQLVVVKLRTKTIIGFIIKRVSKPEFSTKSIEKIILETVVPAEHIQLFNWLQHYYPGPLGISASQFVPPRITVSKLPPLSTRTVQSTNEPLPELTHDQKNAIKQISNRTSGATLLHGDTGSGKTMVYIALAQQAIRQGKSVLILTPEISLTPQLAAMFERYFTNPIVTHSELSDTARRELWRELASATTPRLLIGPRSSLFMPLKNVGLIIVDEFHEHAYKQDQSPRYRAVRVATVLTELHKEARLVLGSATPPIDDYYYAQNKHIPIIRMTEKPLVTSKDYPVNKRVVNLADASERTKHPLLSNTLLKAMQSHLNNNEQIMLFLNKRGSARLLVCQACGWFAKCNKCDLPFTYHGDTHSLRCHTCGSSRPAPNNCESCGSSDILFKSPGTKAIETAIRAHFPDARIARFDKDNTKDEQFSSQAEAVARGDIDILIGTQLLAKGHDLPKLSLVGILLADNELQFPDYSSEERSYQLLHQLAGRVGRGHRQGTVIVQTYNPDALSIKAIDHDTGSWETFYRNQLEQRKQFFFPPFCFLLKIEVHRAHSATAEKVCTSIAQAIQQHHPDVQVIGPSPSFIARRGGQWHWQIIVKSSQRTALIDIIKRLPPKTMYDLDPLSLL